MARSSEVRRGGTSEREPDPPCLRCRQYYVTWRAERPRGCRAYGFESLELPCLVVRRESGEPCRLFEERGG